MEKIFPLAVAIFFLRSMIKIGAASARKKKAVSQKTQSPAPSAPPKPWQIGKHNVKPVLNGKAARGKAFGQRVKKSNYNSAFEDKGIFSGGSVAAFGDERDVISSGSMAAINREYIDVGNDYVSGFDVGGRKETPNGFDR